MFINRCAIAALASVIAAAWISDIEIMAQGQPQHKNVHTITIDTVQLPGGLSTLFQRADVVLRGRIVGSRQTVRRHPAVDDIEPIMEHRLKVLEVFKGEQGLLKYDLIIDQVAGQVENVKGVYRVENWTAFQPGEVYVMFLRKSADKDSYFMDAGQSAAYLIGGGHARTQGKSYLQTGMEDELLRILRSFGSR